MRFVFVFMMLWLAGVYINWHKKGSDVNGHNKEVIPFSVCFAWVCGRRAGQDA